MPHVLFVWNDEIVEYIAQHGVSPQEFEEVVLNSREVRKSHSSGRPIVFGPTSTGKFLACVFEYIDRDPVIPVTFTKLNDGIGWADLNATCFEMKRMRIC